MTLDQKKQVTDALVAFVLTVTGSSHFIDDSEAKALPAILDFLMITDSSESIYNSIPETVIGSAVMPDLYKMAKKFAKSKE